MIEDDDLPVLTQVLRTGSGLAPAVDRVFLDAAVPNDARVEPSFPRALVIGNEAEDDDLPPSYRAEAIADPRRIDTKSNDVFLRTAPTDDAYDESIDEPHFLAHAPPGETDAYTTIPPATPATPASSSRHSPIARADVDAAFAAQIRDAVLDDLSSRIDTEFDARIAQTLHAGLEAALAQLQASLRAELAEALRDVVGRAVDDAIRRTLPSPSADVH